MESKEALPLQIICNAKMMFQLVDVYLRRVLMEPELPTRETLFVCETVHKLTFNAKTRENYGFLCEWYKSFLREIDYTDFPSIREDNTFDVREMAMFMREMNQKGFVVYNKREELPKHLTTLAFYIQRT